MIIGIAKGPGDTPNEYTFVTPDTERRVKTSEFVYYEADVDGTQRQILGRVIRRIPLRLYPDSFLAHPEVDPAQMAALVGYANTDAISEETREEADTSAELFEIHVSIMGYHDAQLSAFVNPRIPPRIGWKIYLAPDNALAEVLNRVAFDWSKGEASPGGAYVGSLLSRPAFSPQADQPDGVPVVLDVRSITATHMAIIAGTGAGKSYLASVLIEEMMKPINRASILVIDPHGEYDTLEEIRNAAEFRANGGYKAEVKTVPQDQVKIRVSDLTFYDMRFLLGAQFGLSGPMEFVLRQALDRVEGDRKDKTAWTTNDLYAALAYMQNGEDETESDQARHSRASSPPQGARNPSSGDGDLDWLDDAEKDAGGSEPQGTRARPDVQMRGSARALDWRLKSLFAESPNFDNIETINLNDVFRPGLCSVLQLNEIDRRQQQVIVAVLLRMVWKARMNAAKGIGSPQDRLDYPVFILLEEAHHFAPANEDVVTTNILKTILAEGRKFGVGVGLISQRPGKLDSDVLSQCMTQFLLRIVNEYDQSSVAAAVESASHDLLAELPALSKGQAIVAGAAVNTPLSIRVRQRITRHGGIEPDAPSEWRAYFSEDAQRRREVDASGLPEGPPRGRSNLLYKSRDRR
ncbi:MAG: ATP-binding protein [Chloroflexi bacterium]|nr:ATP-binding protein [Chloroflexota bacterium]